MFEILKEQPADQAIGGIYYAVRLITEMKGLKEPWSTIVQGLASLPSEIGALDHRIGKQIIDDIERAEGKRLPDIPTENASKYIVNLAQQLEDVVQKTSRYDQQRGNRLLEVLRNPNSKSIPPQMAGIYGFSLPDFYAAGASFMLSGRPWQDHSQDINGALAVIKAGQESVHVALNQIPSGATADDIVDACLRVAQKFLDLLAVQQQLSYRIIHQYDYVIWQRTDGLQRFEVGATLPLTAGMTARPTLIRADGSVALGAPAQSPEAQNAFRYYRFASSSEDLFEAYRYLYLSLESALDDLHPSPNRGEKKQGEKPRSEKKWLGDALRQAISLYSLDLGRYSTAALDPVDQFIKQHYELIRCATFHGKKGSLMPGNLEHVTRVDEELRNLQPIVRQLLKTRFGVGFPSSGITSYGLNSLLESLIPHMFLATSPMEVQDLAQEVLSSLTSSGYFDALPKSPADVTESTIEKLNETFLKAQERFSFDLLHITLDGRRPGYDDEWIITAKTPADEPRHGEIRSMALVFMFDQKTLDNPFLLMAATALSNKTLRTNISLIGSNIVFKIRVVRRSFQEFPKEFGSY
jgi:hypothetical protein